MNVPKRIIGIVLLLIVTLSIWANVSGILVTWTAPSAREDGSPISLAEIAGYHIYYGTLAGDYQQDIYVADPTATSYHITGLVPNTYYMVLTTVDTDGRESIYSPEIIVTITGLFPPNPVTNLILYVGMY